MLTIVIPYELIERAFGTFVADHFNTFMSILAVIGLAIAITRRKVYNATWMKRAQEKQDKRFEYMNDHIKPKTFTRWPLKISFPT